MAKTQITTGKVRLSYAHLFEPYSNNGQEAKYSVTLLIPKSDKYTLDKIKQAVASAKEAYTAKKSKACPPNLKTTLHDGDGLRPSGDEFGAECKGCYVITVSSKNKPVLVNADKTPIAESTELYSGCWARAIINFYVYDTNGNRGITAGLNGIMKIYDGEPLGGGTITADDWDDEWTDNDLDSVSGEDDFLN